MKDQFLALQDEALKLIPTLASSEAIIQARIDILGRKGRLATLMSSLGQADESQRKELGIVANEVKQAIEQAMTSREQQFQAQAETARLERERIDVTQTVLPRTPNGHTHPVTQVQNDLEDLFSSMGFMVADGPQLESDYYNFTALNMGPTHPARDMQDTFYIEGHSNMVMRTQTSSAQVRVMREYGVPLRAIIPGRCFRNESTDARHEHTFHQLEGMVIGKNISFAHMKGVFQAVADHLFGKGTQIRLMPKLYPFVEPGVRGELTCFLCKGNGCRVCKGSGWLEAMPGGMIHPNVLKEGGVDPTVYSGFAFGFGLTRLAMLKFGIDDIRLFESGDVKFLNQF